MNKRRVGLICAGVLLLVMIAGVTAVNLKINKKYYITGDIRSAKVVSSLDEFTFRGGPKETEDEKQIAVLLDCIKKVRLNNKYRNTEVEIAPIFYEITFTFRDGKTATYSYTEYPATRYEYPFQDFYKFFPEFPEDTAKES